MRKVELEIESYTASSIDLIKLLKKNVGRYKLGYILYSRLLKRINPKVIYSVASYSYLGDMIAAAKDLGVKTIEFLNKTYAFMAQDNSQTLLDVIGPRNFRFPGNKLTRHRAY